MVVVKLFKAVKSVAIGLLWNTGCSTSSNCDDCIPTALITNDIIEGLDLLDIPYDVLCLIAKRLIDVKDYIRFGAVCNQFRSVYGDLINQIPQQVPVLVIPTQFDEGGKTRSFYSISEKRIYPFRLPIPHDMFVCSSSHGWLVIVSENYDISLLNPFLSVNNVICLPSLLTLEPANRRHWFPHCVRKAVLSESPASNPNYLVLVIHGIGDSIAVSKSGKAWIKLDLELFGADDVFCNSFHQMCLVNFHGVVAIYDLSNPSCPKQMVVLPAAPFTSDAVEGRYVAPIPTGLLLIKRNRRYDGNGSSHYQTHGFRVFSLDFRKLKWNEVNSLNDRVLFLGHNSSFSSVSALDYPGCKPNCIYFTDDHREGYVGLVGRGEGGPHDMGVYHLEDKSLEPHYPMESEMILPPPIFVEPTAQLRCD